MRIKNLTFIILFLGIIFDPLVSAEKSFAEDVFYETELIETDEGLFLFEPENDKEIDGLENNSFDYDDAQDMSYKELVVLEEDNTDPGTDILLSTTEFAFSYDNSFDISEEETDLVLLEMNEPFLLGNDLVDSGTCGENLTWELRGTGGSLTLSISGTGMMTSHPWGDYQNRIRYLVIGEGVTSVCEAAFYKATRLQEVTLPDTLVQIDDEAFWGCENLAELMLPSNITNIKYKAFGGCTSLTNIHLPEKLEFIGTGAFGGCIQLATIEFPETLRLLMTDAFAGCTSLSEIKIPSLVNKVDEAAFYGCSGLTKVEFSEGVEVIAGDAFRNCSSLKEIYLPVSINLINSNAFEGCDQFDTVYYAGSRKQFNSVPSNPLLWFSDVEVICLGGEDDVIVMAYGACGENASFKIIKENGDLTIIISGSGTMINPGFDQYNLYGYNTKAVVEEGITTLGKGAFINSNIAQVSLPDSLTTIGTEAFKCCALQSVSLPSKITSIPDSAFYENSLLTTVELPASLETIGESAFEGCRSLAEIDLPDTVYEIGDRAFAYSGLSSIRFPGEIYRIPKLVCCECPKLTTVSIQPGIFGIDYGAFSDCTALTSVRIPESIRTISERAFSKCSKVKNVYFGGTESQWKEVQINSGNNNLLSAAIHYNQFYLQISATLSKTLYTYDGTYRKPSVEVKADGKSLKKGTDYKVSYSDHKKVGTATVTIIGIGDYSGREKVTFTIRPRTTLIKSLTAGSKKFTVKWAKRIKQTDGYHIQYSTDKTFSSGRKNIKIRNNETVSKTVNGLKQGKRYYVRIRCFKEKDGVVYYSKWSDVETIKTK